MSCQQLLAPCLVIMKQVPSFLDQTVADTLRVFSLTGCWVVVGDLSVKKQIQHTTIGSWSKNAKNGRLQGALYTVRHCLQALSPWWTEQKAQNSSVKWISSTLPNNYGQPFHMETGMSWEGEHCSADYSMMLPWATPGCVHFGVGCTSVD